MSSKSNPRAFRDHVISVAGRRDPGVTLDEIAADYGLEVDQVVEWLRQDAVGVRAERDGQRLDCERASEADVRSRLRFMEAENRALRAAIAGLSGFTPDFAGTSPDR